MLVLTRKPGERIVVGNRCDVEIVSVARGVVKFCFRVDAPVILLPGNIELDTGGAPGETHPITITRKVDDSVVINAGGSAPVEVLVVSVKGEAVRVGVKAPRDVTVHRQEVWEMIQQENIAAAQVPADIDPGQLAGLLKGKGKKPSE